MPRKPLARFVYFEKQHSGIISRSKTFNALLARLILHFPARIEIWQHYAQQVERAVFFFPQSIWRKNAFVIQDLFLQWREFQ